MPAGAGSRVGCDYANVGPIKNKALVMHVGGNNIASEQLRWTVNLDSRRTYSFLVPWL